MSFIRAHWRLIAIFLTSVAFVMYARGQVGPVAAKARNDLGQARSSLDRTIRDILADVEAHKAPANVAIVRTRARRAALADLIQTQAALLSFQLAPDYNIDSLGAAADDDARYEFYMRRLGDVTGRLRFTRLWEPTIVDSEGSTSAVGFDFTLEGGPGSATLKQKLLRLDILRRVADAAITSKVARVSEFVFLADGALSELNKRIPGTGRASSTDGASATPPLRALGVQLTAQGSQGALLALLASLQQPAVDGAAGRALAIESFTLSKEDWKAPQTDMLSLQATLIAYSVVTEAELPEASIVQALQRRPTVQPGNGQDNRTSQPNGDDPFGNGKEGGSGERNPRRRR